MEKYDIKISFYNDDIILWDSFKIKFKDIKDFISSLYLKNNTSDVLKQDKSILCAELFVHNVLYKLGIKRVKTQNCNLSIYENLKSYEKIIYKIFSIFFK